MQDVLLRVFGFGFEAAGLGLCAFRDIITSTSHCAKRHHNGAHKNNNKQATAVATISIVSSS